MAGPSSAASRGCSARSSSTATAAMRRDNSRDDMRERLKAGDILVLFPEGTSSDGREVLPFKSSFFGAAEIEGVLVQPVSIAYRGHRNLPMTRRLMPSYAWYGDMDLAPHLLEALATGPVEVAVICHPPLSLGRRAEPQGAGPPRRGGGAPGRGPRASRIRAKSARARAMEPVPKKVFVKTYGCQMNVYDSERMRDVLAPLGYVETAAPEEADLVILNTCHIREKAAEKVYSELGKIRKMKRARAEQGAEMLIAVAGCVAQAEGEEIVKRAPAVDLVFGPQTYHRLPQLLARQRGGREGHRRNRISGGREVRRAERPGPAAQVRRGLPDRAGGLRQVLHLLRGALYARRGILAARGTGAGAKPASWRGRA